MLECVFFSKRLILVRLSIYVLAWSFDCIYVYIYVCTVCMNLFLLFFLNINRGIPEEITVYIQYTYSYMTNLLN